MKVNIIEIEGNVLVDLLKERQRQNRLHPYVLDLSIMFAVLSEEVGEVAEALQAHYQVPGVKDTDKDNLYQELIEVAAVAIRMAERL